MIYIHIIQMLLVLASRYDYEAAEDNGVVMRLLMGSEESSWNPAFATGRRNQKKF